MPDRELLQPIDRPTQLIKSNVNNPQKLGLLLSNAESTRKKRDKLIDSITEVIDGFDDDEMASFSGKLLTNLGKEDKQWTVDKRDGALELLRVVDLTRVPSVLLLNQYISSISGQLRRQDAFGSIDSLLQAGKVIARQFPPDGPESPTKMIIKNEWIKIESQFDVDSLAEDRSHVRRQSDEIVRLVPEVQQQIPEDNGMPDFNDTERELNEAYIETVGRERLFKRAIWRNIPEFRKICEEHGIRLERFWNLHDPDEVMAAVDRLKEEASPATHSVVNKVMKNHAGVTLDEIIPEESVAIADEIVQSVQKAVGEMLRSVGSFDAITAKFGGILQEASNVSPKRQKAMLWPIANFFREHGIPVDSIEASSLTQLIEDESIMGNVRSAYELRQQGRVEEARKLSRMFSFDDKSDNFALISRKKEDLYLGDLTGDCTAYHMQGMNAWTVPAWLANPGFTMFKIIDKGVLVAKAGLILSLADGKPSIVMDSFETGKSIKDEEHARELIDEGFSYLQRWAKKIGLPDIYLVTYANSSGASEILRSKTSPSTLEKNEALGGLSGLAEAKKNIANQPPDKRIYLQSAESSDEAQEEQAEEVDIDGNILRRFERYLTDISKELNPDDRREFYDILRTNDLSNAFSFIITNRYTKLGGYFGTDIHQYMDILLKSEEHEYVGNPFVDMIIEDHQDSETDSGDLLDEEAAEKRMQYIDELEDMGIDTAYDMLNDNESVSSKLSSKYDQVIEEARDLTDLLFTLQDLEESGASAELALRKLYGTIQPEAEEREAEDVPQPSVVDDSLRFTLSVSLPRLDIKDIQADSIR